MSGGRFSRSAMLYGKEAQAKIESASAAICGVGAVGSFALEALARIGIGKFYLFDFDAVEISNINRQLCALTSTIGKKKVEVAAARVEDINPAAKVLCFEKFIGESNCADIINCSPDVIVDAIDSISSKAALISSALRAGVPVVSSMGAARRTDASKICVARLFKTFNCPMAARLRKQLRALGVEKAPVECVFSSEAAPANTHETSGDGKKIVGSTPIVTGIFGLRLAGLALDEILKK